jgi:Helix-turn-helix domain
VKLSRGARACLKMLESHLGGKDYCWPSQATIARKMACSVRQVKRYIQELVKGQLVTSLRHTAKSPHTYKLQPKMAPSMSLYYGPLLDKHPNMNLKPIELGSARATHARTPPPFEEQLTDEQRADIEDFYVKHNANITVLYGDDPYPGRYDPPRKPVTSQRAPVLQREALQ